MNRPKQIGTTAETAVVNHARKHGFPGADRQPLRGNADQGDIGLCPGIIVEVKAGNAARNATTAQTRAWLAETERERANAAAAYGLLVIVPKGVGPARLGDEAVAAFTYANADGGVTRYTLDDALAFLRAAGYGDPIDPDRDPRLDEAI